MNVKQAKDETGHKYGRLLVIERRPSRNSQAQWLCTCDCGKEVVVPGSSLRRAYTKSCGCLNLQAIIRRNTKHGEAAGRAFTPEYRAWESIRGRCTATAGPGRRNYSNRGITICERWNVYKNFLEDMGRRPSPQHSIDRIDNNGSYTPENCRWATRHEQARNKRTNRFLTHEGRTLVLADWARERGLKHTTIIERLKRGWSIDRALSSPA